MQVDGRRIQIAQCLASFYQFVTTTLILQKAQLRRQPHRRSDDTGGDGSPE